MAEKTKTFVEVDIGVKEAFDNKYKSTSAKAIKEAFEEAIEKSAILTTKASDKKGSLALDGNLSLTKTEDGIAGKLSMAMSRDRSIFGTVTSETSFGEMNPAKIKSSDVDDLIEEILKDAKPRVIKALETKAKAK
jgi:hypothetical protein